jgi:hypothetical protein
MVENWKVDVFKMKEWCGMDMSLMSTQGLLWTKA